jgi:RNA polymerase sigma-70 factor (ECF subfamily)
MMGTTTQQQMRFEGLVEEHRRILYKVCNVYCGTPDDREDLAQEILVELWRSFGSFDGRCLFSTWMYRVALNTAISFNRRKFSRQRHLTLSEDRVLASVPARESEPAEVRILYELIEGLDPFNKALLLLYLDGNSYQEISEVLGISVTNVATKLNRLKEALKQKVAAPTAKGHDDNSR